MVEALLNAARFERQSRAVCKALSPNYCVQSCVFINVCLSVHGYALQDCCCLAWLV